MKKVLFCIGFLVCALAHADTLDLARYTAVVTVSESRNIEVLASDNLSSRALAVLGRASYDADLTVADYLAVHSRQARRLERMTLESRRGDTKFRSDGGVTVDFEFPILGPVMEQLLPEQVQPELLGRVACPCCGQEWPEGQEVPPGVELVPYEDDDTPAYTGILVDARGLEFQPALFPKVVTETGDVVIGPDFADEDELAEKGAAGYYLDRNEALTGDRTGSNPLVVNALSVAGRNRCDLVVNGAAAAEIHGSSLNLQHLAECRVGILVDR